MTPTSGPRGTSGCRRLGRGPEGPSATPAGVGAEAPQPEDVVAAEPRRTPVPRDEAAVRLHQDALPGIGENRRLGVYPDWADQPLSQEACLES